MARRPKDEHGTLAFVEFYSKDALAAKRVLGSVFGWKFTKTSAGGVDIWMFRDPAGVEGHMMAPLGMTQGTVAFVKVRSLDEVIRKVPKLGGKILIPRFEVPGMGWFAYFRAPGGTVHAAFEQAPHGGARAKQA